MGRPSSVTASSRPSRKAWRWSGSAGPLGSGAPCTPAARGGSGRLASEVYVGILVASSPRRSTLVLFFLSAPPALQAEGGAGEIRGTGSCPNPLHPKGRGLQRRGREPGDAARGQRRRAGVPSESLGESISGEQGARRGT